jgi:hypothetical protein
MRLTSGPVNTLAVLSVLVTGKASTGVHDAQFGELEAVIMNGLWARDRSALTRKAVDDLQKDRQIARATVMTVMDNLYPRGG